MAVHDFFLDETTTEFMKQLIVISLKHRRYKNTFDNIINLIEDILPTISEIQFSGVELPAHRQAQIRMFSTTLEKGKELMKKVQNTSRWNIIEQRTLARRIGKLEKKICDFLKAPVLTHILADIHHLQCSRFDLLDRSLEKVRELLGSMEIEGEGIVRDPMELADATMEIESNNTDDSEKVEAELEFGKEVIEEWEFHFEPVRFAYEELSIFTKKFNEKQLLGKGGFGQVYKGKLPGSDSEIAVKRTSHGSRQGMSEFLAEISTIGCLRHQNLVRLLGYCKHKEELFLVYDYMPNGSLDKYINPNENQERLTWEQRFKIIKDVASALLYMHQEWKQVIIHRDIKPANVLIDHEMNARLRDFGLAKLYDHGFDPQTSKVAGTFGYMAPEFVRTGRATTNADIYAFGVVMLELVCGRRLFDQRAEESEEFLGDWILDLWEKGDVIDAAEVSIRQEENKGQIELVLKLGVLCSHQVVSIRPDISKVMSILNGDSQLPDNLLDVLRREKFKGWHETSPMEVLLDVNSFGTNTFNSDGREIVDYEQEIQSSEIEDNEQEVQNSEIEDNEQVIQNSKIEDNEQKIQSSEIEDNEQKIQSYEIEDNKQI